MMRHILTICLLAISVFVSAEESIKTRADSAYAKENYELAVQLYTQVEPSAAICYNLGNCHYRMDDIAHAILWYERAALLSPGDADVRFNLDLARSKTIDKVTPRHEFFFVDWYRSFVNLMAVDAWGWLAFCLFVLSLVALLVYVYTTPLWLRKAGFTLCIIGFLCCVLANMAGFSQRYRLSHRTGAVVMASSAVVKGTPSASALDLFVLHEGTRVDIRDNSLNEWVEVELADGKIGWIPRQQIEII